MASKLLQMQFRFTRCIAQLINFATAQGWGLTVGDFHRDQRTNGAWGVKRGYSAAYSVHKMRLAADLNLFIDGKWVTDGNCAEYKLLGEEWKKIDPQARWGGDFASGDANHFSFIYQGYR